MIGFYLNSKVTSGLRSDSHHKFFIKMFDLIVDLLTDTKNTLQGLLSEYHQWFYAILFLIIFVETGVVIMPFLPGDSLLFTAGFLAATSDDLNVYLLMILLTIAAILGDTMNYLIGKYIGEKALETKIFGRRFVKPEYIEKTHAFFEKHGTKAIIIARFVPIVRTLAPFVAGVGRMKYSTFLSYNIIGGIVWVVGVTLLGYALGENELVQKHFEKVILGIVFVSVLPIIVEVVKAKFGKKSSKEIKEG